MIWVILSLVSAFSAATSDALTKNALRYHSEYLVAWAVTAIGAVIFLILLPFVPKPALDRDFYIAFGCALPLEIASVILYTKALKVSPLSLTLPFLSLTPAFLLITPFILLGETIGPAGMTGILALTWGAYLLNIGTFKDGILQPFRAIGREKGSIYMIIVAAIYSVTATLGKRAIEHSSPSFFIAAYVPVLAVLLAPFALIAHGRRNGNAAGTFGFGHLLKHTILPGILFVVGSLAHSWAVKLTQVAYMISVKRLSLLIGVVYGWMFFKERGLRERLLGAALMLAGFVVIVLFGR
jgi:drug/metabolite transporter (DMT)-like permease